MKKEIIYFIIFTSIFCNIEKEEERYINFIKYYYSFFKNYFYHFDLTFYYNKYKLQIYDINIFSPKNIDLSFKIDSGGEKKLKLNDITFTFITKMKIKTGSIETKDNNVFFEIKRKESYINLYDETFELQGGNINFIKKKYNSVIDCLKFFKSFTENERAKKIEYTLYDQKIIKENKLTFNTIVEFFNKLIEFKNNDLKKHINLMLYDFFQISNFLKKPFNNDNILFNSLEIIQITNYINDITFNKILNIKNLMGKGNIKINNTDEEFSFSNVNIIFNKTINQSSSGPIINFSLYINWDYIIFYNDLIENNNQIKYDFIQYLKTDYEKYINNTIYEYFFNIYE